HARTGTVGHARAGRRRRGLPALGRGERRDGRGRTGDGRDAGVGATGGRVSALLLHYDVLLRHLRPPPVEGVRHTHGIRARIQIPDRGLITEVPDHGDTDAALAFGGDRQLHSPPPHSRPS